MIKVENLTKRYGGVTAVDVNPNIVVPMDEDAQKWLAATFLGIRSGRVSISGTCPSMFHCRTTCE